MHGNLLTGATGSSSGNVLKPDSAVPAVTIPRRSSFGGTAGVPASFRLSEAGHHHTAGSRRVSMVGGPSSGHTADAAATAAAAAAAVKGAKGSSGSGALPSCFPRYGKSGKGSSYLQRLKRKSAFALSDCLPRLSAKPCSIGFDPVSGRGTAYWLQLRQMLTWMSGMALFGLLLVVVMMASRAGYEVDTAKAYFEVRLGVCS